MPEYVNVSLTREEAGALELVLRKQVRAMSHWCRSSRELGRAAAEADYGQMIGQLKSVLDKLDAGGLEQ